LGIELLLTRSKNKFNATVTANQRPIFKAHGWDPFGKQLLASR
jgi:hypothetical protein